MTHVISANAFFTSKTPTPGITDGTIDFENFAEQLTITHGGDLHHYDEWKVYNVLDYDSSIGQGNSANDTQAILDAIADAESAVVGDGIGGVIVLPPIELLIESLLHIQQYGVHLWSWNFSRLQQGCRLKMADGADLAHILRLGLTGTSTLPVMIANSIEGICFDGNKANQTTDTTTSLVVTHTSNNARFRNIMCLNSDGMGWWVEPNLGTAFSNHFDATYDTCYFVANRKTGMYVQGDNLCTYNNMHFVQNGFAESTVGACGLHIDTWVPDGWPTPTSLYSECRGSTWNNVICSFNYDDGVRIGGVHEYTMNNVMIQAGANSKGFHVVAPLGYTATSGGTALTTGQDTELNVTNLTVTDCAKGLFTVADDAYLHNSTFTNVTLDGNNCDDQIKAMVLRGVQNTDFVNTKIRRTTDTALDIRYTAALGVDTGCTDLNFTNTQIDSHSGGVNATNAGDNHGIYIAGDSRAYCERIAFSNTKTQGELTDAAGGGYEVVVTDYVQGIEFHDQTSLDSFHDADTSRAFSLGATAIGNVRVKEWPWINNAEATDTIASAATITLPCFGDFFHITGTTDIGTVNGGWHGRKITLRTTSALYLLDSGNIITNWNDIELQANDTVTLVYDADDSSWVVTDRPDAVRSIFLRRDAVTGPFQTFAPGPVAPTFDVEDRKDGDFTFTATGSEVTIARDGRYRVTYGHTVVMNANNTTRTTSWLWFQVDTGSGFVNDYDTVRMGYHRTKTGAADDSYGSIETSFEYNFSANDVIRFQAWRWTGSATLKINNATLTVERLGPSTA